MICRKCGTTLADNSIRCSNCGIKVSISCPKCRTLNRFGEKNCTNCGFELIKICPACNSANIYSSSQCRKCKTLLIQSDTQVEIKTVVKVENDFTTEIVEPISTSKFMQTTAVEVAEESNYEFIKDVNAPQIEEEPSTEVVNKDKYEDKTCCDIKDEHPDKTDEEIISQNTDDVIDEEIQTEENIDETLPVEESSVDIEKNDVEQSQDEDTVEMSITEETIAVDDTEEEKEEETTQISEEETAEIDEQIDEEDVQIQQIEEEITQNDIQSTEEQETEINSDGYQDVQSEIDTEEENNSQQEEEPEQTEPQYIIQQSAVIEAIQYIKKSIKKHIIAINGPEGCGKTAALSQIRNILVNDKYLCLCGSCTPLSQITSFGYFQDAFLRMIGLPPYINNSEAFIKEFKKSELNKIFNFLDSHELSLFVNLLYPSQRDDFENILENKQLMFSVIEKVIKRFLTNSNIVMIIDNFDLLDGASYDFLAYMASKNFFNNRLKLLVAYQEAKQVQNYFDASVKDDNIFATIGINRLNSQELADTINSAIGINLPQIIPSEYLAELIIRSDGNAINLEQNIAYLFDANYLQIQGNEIVASEENKPENEPKSLDELMKLRLSLLPAEVKNVLFMASIMGYRFATNILCNAAPLPGKKALKVLDILRQELFVVPVDDFTCEFKNLTIWKHIYKEAKADPLFKDNSERLYSILKTRVLSSNIQKLISCVEALNKEEEFIIWQDTSSISARLGDTNLYVIAQKQCLKILEEQSFPNADEVKEIIYEQIGKLLSQKSPNEAISYLANVLDTKIKANDVNKIIDISGYFVTSCYLTGNYYGVKEAVDAVLTSVNSTKAQIPEINIALIKTRKLIALLNIGNTEEIIHLIRDEISPELNKELSIKHTDISYRNLLTDAWFLSNITLAKAYLMQGKQEVFSITAVIKEYMENNKIQSEYYSAQIDIIEAFAHSTRGEINLSNDIITAVLDRFNETTIDKKLLCELNLVSILNRIFSNQMLGLKEDLYELATFSNNINEFFVKNIVKLILGYIVKEEGDTTKALNIYNEQITYFAKEKVALGALLAWSLIIRASIDDDDIEMALNTATKALEIAQGPKINNFFFIIYFQKYIAEIYRIKGDLVAVKMYLEKALLIAKQNNLRYQLTQLYIDYGKYMECYMKTQQDFNEEYLKATIDMYNKAISIANELKVDALIEKTNRERANFRRYCQLHSIEI